MNQKSSYPSPITHSPSPVTYIHKLTLSLLFLISFFVSGLFSLCLLNSSATAGWQSEQIDYSVFFPSLAFDAQGNPAIAYYRDETRTITYAYYDGASWVTNHVTTGGYYVSLAFDPSGKPAISFVPGGYPKYAHFNGASWNVTTLPEPSIPGTSGPSAFGTSLAFDASGNPAIAYTLLRFDNTSPFDDQELFNLKYAHFNGTSWDITTIARNYAGNFSSGSYPNNMSLAFDALGNPSISFTQGVWTYDSVSNQNRFYYYLKYAHFNGTSWDTTTLDSGWYLGFEFYHTTSLAFDASGNPAIAYSDGDLRYANFNGTSWDIVSHINNESVRFTSLAFDPSGKPAIAYLRHGAGCDYGCLGYAHFNGTSWDTTTLGGNGTYASLAFDVFGNPAIVHTSGSGRYLDYVHFVPDTTTTTTTSTTTTTTVPVIITTTSTSMTTTSTTTSSTTTTSTTTTTTSTTIPNTPPTANAGVDQTVHIGDVVTLNGSGSVDADGDTLTYSWAFTSTPLGSTATLSTPISVNTTFTADVVGTYIVSLVVNDGTIDSAPDTVTISTTNTVPVTAAGHDQLITLIGATVTLNGTQSYDVDGDPITFQWTFASKPAGSTASLSGANTATPTFVPDVYGSYTVQLVVSDRWTQSSPDTVIVSFENIKPVANAGTSQSVVVGNVVTLNGSGSSDANGDFLTYSWTLSSVPVGGSLSYIANPTATMTSFVPDLPGTYVAQLIVTDGFVDSVPSTMQVQAVTLQTIATQAVQSNQTQIASLSPTVLKNPTMQNALLNKLNAVIANIEAGLYADALGQLQNDILGKTNGCANTGAPDANDWIKDCASQGIIYPLILDAIAKVQALL